ncbi:hypothetical protein KI387_019042, partial [Taxus chinensis]
ILTWEDGHYEPIKPPGISKTSTFTTPDSLLKGWDAGGKLRNYGARGQDGSSMEDKIGLLVDKMSHQMHPLGEGTVGSIAFSGKHQWIYPENFLSGRNFLGSVDASSSFEYPDGWQNQFSAGIKTIAVIAAVPFGVVQLGSRQTIMEDLELIRHVKTLFGSVHNVSRPFSHDHDQELLSERIHETRSLAGTKYATLLHGIPNQSMLKNSSSNVSEQGGDSFSIWGMSKGFQTEAYALPSVCSSSSLAKSLCQFSQLRQKGLQLISRTPSLAHEQETLSRETRTLSNARVIYPRQGTQQASSCKDGKLQSLFIGKDIGNNRLALMEQQLAKEMGLERKLPLFPTNGQSTGQLKFQNNTLSTSQETSFLNDTFDAVKSTSSDIMLQCNLSVFTRDEVMPKTGWFESGSSGINNLKQIEILPSVPALQDVLRQPERSTASSMPLVHTNCVERMDRNPLAELDTCHAYKDSMFSSTTIQAPVSAAGHPHYAYCGMTSGQLEAALQEPVSNDLISSLGEDISIPAALGLGPQSRDKEITTEDVLSFFQDVIVDNSYSAKENFKTSEAGFGEVLPATDECVFYAFDDPNSITNEQKNSINSITLPVTDELFDVLGPDFNKTQDQATWDDISLPTSHVNNGNFTTHSFRVSSGSACPSEVDLSQNFTTSMDRQLDAEFFSERKSEHLLDAVVANILPSFNNGADDNTSSKISFSRLSSAPSLDSPSVKADSCFTGPLSGSEQSKYADLSHCRHNSDIKTVQSSFTFGFQGEASAKSSPANSDLKTQLSSWIEDSKGAKFENPGLSQAKKLDEPVKVNRKRAKPGERSRPRPKDRQQIQDRVKELREIVPNGSKCSIDALLERTIKHMLFLQSITKHADKLKQSCEPKVLDKDGGLFGKGSLEGGASWALEVGGQSMWCPIIVENMSQPRQMLVEMLCEERGLFLEIADIIRRLGLTILKGVMEVRHDKIWAHFAVEANRDVHRVEILWSLMQLLQQNIKNRMTTSSQPSIITHQGI